MNRRKFLAGTGVLVGASIVASSAPSLTSAGESTSTQELSMPPSTATKPAGRIDVHHHLIPPAYVETMQRYGLSKVAGAALPAWTAQSSIEVMDA